MRSNGLSSKYPLCYWSSRFLWYIKSKVYDFFFTFIMYIFTKTGCIYPQRSYQRGVRKIGFVTLEVKKEESQYKVTSVTFLRKFWLSGNIPILCDPFTPFITLVLLYTKLGPGPKVHPIITNIGWVNTPPLCSWRGTFWIYYGCTYRLTIS